MISRVKSYLEEKLREGSGGFFTLYTMVVSFGAYFCMYAFRKPFTVGTYDGLEWLGMDYKIILVIAQVLGYASSKFLGIKFISELNRSTRLNLFLGLILMAELMLFFFGLVTRPYKIIFLFLNGLPLGMIWGIVFSYLEGRRQSEILGAALSVSFIISSGAVKSVGSWVILEGISSEWWMPFITGLGFLPFLFLFAWLLDLIPPPNRKDEQLRTYRTAMGKKQRWKMLQKFSFGLFMMIVFYTGLSAYRDFRDNFAVEIWAGLGYTEQPSIFTLAELPIAIIVLAGISALMLIKNNKAAFRVYHWLVIGSMTLVVIATYLFQYGYLAPALWMVLVGLGLYLAYVPFNCLIFDRMLATFRYVGTAGFLIYLADSFGYLGSIAVLVIKNFAFLEISWLNFFIQGTYWIGFGGTFLMVGSLLYFNKKMKNPVHEEPALAIKIKPYV